MEAMMKKQMYSYPKIDTDRLYIKVLTLDNVHDVFHHFSDAEITKFMDIEPCKDINEAKDIIQYHLDDIGCRWGMFLKSANIFIGTCGYHYIRQENNTVTAEIGFDLAKNFWGNGYMHEALVALIKFGFTQMKLDIIDATVDPNNQRSQNVMLRLGFYKALEQQDGLDYFFLTKEDWLD